MSRIYVIPTADLLRKISAAEIHDESCISISCLVLHHTAACISNTQGTVTKCVLPEAGVYELDDRVCLYLTHCECLDMCRGVRCGSVMELHNMHVMKLSGTPWKVKFNNCSVSGGWQNIHSECNPEILSPRPSEFLFDSHCYMIWIPIAEELNMSQRPQPDFN